MLAVAFWRSEKWLHQHVFKVGWLLSRNNNTTVIFYYTAFLPGVLLHELITWLTAGICNVRAARAVQLPQQEQISALQLGFVRLANSVHPFKRLVIEVVPLFVALFVLWHIAVDILDVGNTWAILASGNLDDVALAISRFTATADFWLWFYLAFSIANTMLPDLPSALKGRKSAVTGDWRDAAGVYRPWHRRPARLGNHGNCRKPVEQPDNYPAGHHER